MAGDQGDQVADRKDARIEKGRKFRAPGTKNACYEIMEVGETQVHLRGITEGSRGFCQVKRDGFMAVVAEWLE